MTLINKNKFIEDVNQATAKMQSVGITSKLEKSTFFSEVYQANIFFKREDLQIVRSYKIRGAYHKIMNTDKALLNNGVVCASAGNHAQGVAYICHLLKVKGYIFMPVTSPNQKVSQVKFFGGEYVEVHLVGDVFDESYDEAQKFCDKNQALFVPPFDDEKIIEGQATIACETLQQINNPIDYMFIGVGGGGVISGVGAYLKYMSPNTKIIAVEPAGAASLKASLDAGHLVTLDKIDKFVDGAAVKRIGALNFEYCKQFVDSVVVVPEGKICTTLLDVYNKLAIVLEPAGALSLTALDDMAQNIKGKNVVCLLSGGNNDIARTQEIRDRSMLYEGLKHYFIINFAQRAGALKEFVNHVLSPTDNIVRFEYMQKNNSENGPALVGIEIAHKNNIHQLKQNLKTHKFDHQHLNESPMLLQFIL